MNIFIAELVQNPEYFWLVTLSVIPSICLHEYFHAQVALWCGDDTAARSGHLTLNPLRQMGWISLILFLVIGIAWGMVPVDRRRLSKRQAVLVSFAGPFMNFSLALLAWCACIFLPGLVLQEKIPALLFQYVFCLGTFNIVLFVINMLPIPGLDGWNMLFEFIRFRPVTSEFVKGAMLLLMLLLVLSFPYVYKAAWFVMQLAVRILHPE